MRAGCGWPFEMDAEVDIENIIGYGFANSDYGSEDSWYDYISLAKTSLVD